MTQPARPSVGELAAALGFRDRHTGAARGDRADCPVCSGRQALVLSRDGAGTALVTASCGCPRNLIVAAAAGRARESDEGS
jgi:hypothetical protein